MKELKKPYLKNVSSFYVSSTKNTKAHVATIVVIMATKIMWLEPLIYILQ